MGQAAHDLVNRVEDAATRLLMSFQPNGFKAYCPWSRACWGWAGECEKMVVSLQPADKSCEPLSGRLRSLNQTVINPRVRFSRPHSAFDRGFWTQRSHTVARLSFSPISLQRLWLWPRRHAKEQHFLQRPHVVGQSGRHRGRARSPLLGRARTVGRNRLGQWLAQTPMGQAEVVVAVVQGQLLVQALFALAQGGDASADRRHMLTDGEVEAFHE